MVLCETKVYGIPTILTGLDFVVMAKKGTVIIYDDNPETIAKESIKILSNITYRRILGNEARESMKKYNNLITIKKWIKLIFAVYEGEESFNRMREETNHIRLEEAINITKSQVNLINMREPFLKNLTFEMMLNFSYLEDILG